MPSFLPTQPSNEDYWRGIVLLGRNVATYKLALAKSLLELAPAGETFITMEELAVPYAHHPAEHLKKAQRQITSSRSQFLDTCRKFNLQGSGLGATSYFSSIDSPGSKFALTTMSTSFFVRASMVASFQSGVVARLRSAPFTANGSEFSDSLF